MNSSISPDTILGMRLASGEITFDDAKKYLYSQMPDEQVISAICRFIDTQGQVDRFALEASAYVDAQHSAAVPAENADSGDDENELLAELRDMDESWHLPQGETPALCVVGSLLSRGLKRSQTRCFVEGFLDEFSQLNALSQYIVDFDLVSIFNDGEAIYPYQDGTSLSFLRSTGLSRQPALLILMDYVDSHSPDGVLGVLCAQIEADGDASLAYSNLDCYERNGVDEEYAAFLQERALMSSSEYFTAVEVFMTDDIPVDRQPSNPDALTVATGRSVLDALRRMGDIGVLTPNAQCGVAVNVLNRGWRDRLRVILCRHIDRAGRQAEFVRFVQDYLEFAAECDAPRNET